MKKVTLKRLKIKNFRGIKDLEIQFSERETTIYGENNTGKSTIMNAFMWLLFGKDAQDRKDFNIKRLVDGKTIDKTEVEVVGVLDVSGETVTLRRAFVERWTKPRGQTEEVFKGNETETSYNEVPMNVSEYQKRVNEIIDDTVFKMVTNPLYFANMRWELQREHLFQLAGTITDSEIAASNPDYAALLDQISGKSFADFKREIAARKRKTKELLETIQPRIDQTQKLMPESRDFEAIEKSARELRNEVGETEAAIEDKTKATKQQQREISDLITQIGGLRQKQQQVVYDAETQLKERAHQANSKRREVQQSIEQTRADALTIERRIDKTRDEIQASKKALEARLIDVNNLREMWFAENAKEYSGETTCHCCGQKLPENMLSEAREKFNEAKSKTLDEITQKGAAIKARCNEAEQDIAQSEKSLKTHENALNEARAKIAELEATLAETPAVVVEEINPGNLLEYEELSDEINAVSTKIEKLKAKPAADVSELREKKNSLQNEIRELEKQLSDRDLIKKHFAEIDELNKQGKQLAQQIADIESVEFTMKAFTKAKIEESEKRINGLFKHVTFRLFDYTQDGNEFETCVPLVDGVPFPVANTAGQLNAGIDIINALTRFHGVSAPVFIDNREGVNEIIPTESQIINLVVTREKGLAVS